MLALALSACDAPVLRLGRWTLHAEGLGSAPTLTLPVHLDGTLPHRDTDFSLTARVELPEELAGRALTFAIVSLPGLATLRADGTELAPIDAPVEDGYRETGARRWRIPAELTADRVLALELSVRARWVQAYWLDNVPRLSATTQGDVWFRTVAMLNRGGSLFGLATILLSSLLYWVLFFNARRRRDAQFWFAFESLCGAGYPAFALGLTQWTFGSYDGAVVGLALSIAALASTYFTHAHLGLPRPSPVIAVIAVGLVLVYLAVGIDPWRMTLHAAPVTALVMVAVATYQSVIVVRLVRAGRYALHEWIVPVAWPFAHLLAATDFVAWLGHGELLGGLRFGSIGIGCIGLAQATALSHEHIRSLARTDELNEELASRIARLELQQRENERLTARLRAQVVERSSQLLAALASIDDREVEMPEPGEVVDGEYEIVRVLGRGGMARVFEARRRSDGVPVALKVSRERRADALARMAREAQIAATVAHRYIVSLLDVRVSSRGFFYLAMERVEGGTLREHLRARPSLEWSIRALLQVLEGLRALHEAGVIHRDLKPENVLVAIDGTLPAIKLVDFGISRWVAAQALQSAPPPALPATQSNEEDTTRLGPSARESTGAVMLALDAPRAPELTAQGLITGTPSYCAPEAYDDSRPTVERDVFGFGVLAFELLAGRRPWWVPPLTERMRGREIPPPVVLAELVPELPAGVADAIQSCLALAPSERPALDDIHAALGGGLAELDARAVHARAAKVRRGAAG